MIKEIPYKEIIPDDEDLKLFIASLRKFDSHFTNAMSEGVDFTLKLEIRGDNMRLHHCRANIEEFRRPKKAKPKE